MGTIVVTGSEGGMGRALRKRLKADGHQVIGVDVAGAEVDADLSTPVGRSAMVDRVTECSEGRIDGLVVAAGLQKGDPSTIVSVNHFGAVATIEGLHPLLASSDQASVVVVSSNSTTTMPGYPVALAEACLAGDEPAATALADEPNGAYAASKLALARWSRRAATTERWIGSGIRLNVIAPGFVDTPMTEGGWDFVKAISDIYPIPVGRPGSADEAAGLIAYLLSPEAAFFCGSFIVMDGGTDAALRPDDWPRPLT